jgi:hypothetical protein
MKQLIIPVMLCALLAQSCKKEESIQNTNVDNSSKVEFDLDGETITKIYSSNKLNEFSGYFFGGVAGNYFGYTTSFDIEENGKMQITFGTALTASSKLTEQEFISLIAPGDKIFGSLGAYGTFPQIKPNRVEIAFRDKKSRKWCSTKIREKERHDEDDDNENSSQFTVEIIQPDGWFKVDKIDKIEVSADKEGYRVRGRFNCMLYQVNGSAKKHVQGSFVGVVVP